MKSRIPKPTSGHLDRSFFFQVSRGRIRSSDFQVSRGRIRISDLQVSRGRIRISDLQVSRGRIRIFFLRCPEVGLEFSLLVVQMLDEHQHFFRFWSLSSYVVLDQINWAKPVLILFVFAQLFFAFGGWRATARRQRDCFRVLAMRVGITRGRVSSDCKDDSRKRIRVA